MKKDMDTSIKKTKRTMVIVVVLLIILTAAGIFMMNKGDFRFDSAAEDGSLEGLTKEQIDEMMQNKVDESMLAISINSTPVFKDGKSKGTLRIENAANNRYNMKVTIVQDKGGKVIYESDAIKPGQIIKEDELSSELAKGKYACTATFTAYDVKTNKKAGEAAAKLNIIIEK